MDLDSSECSARLAASLAFHECWSGEPMTRQCCTARTSTSNSSDPTMRRGIAMAKSSAMNSPVLVCPASAVMATTENQQKKTPNGTNKNEKGSADLKQTEQISEFDT